PAAAIRAAGWRARAAAGPCPASARGSRRPEARRAPRSPPTHTPLRRLPAPGIAPRSPPNFGFEPAEHSSARASSGWKLPPGCAKIAANREHRAKAMTAREDGMSLTQTAFGQLMRLYGREAPDFVRFDEGPQVLATRFAADEAVSAALAAGGTVAADL